MPTGQFAVATAACGTNGFNDVCIDHVQTPNWKLGKRFATNAAIPLRTSGQNLKTAMLQPAVVGEWPVQDFHCSSCGHPDRTIQADDFAIEHRVFNDGLD
jgi:hypothetical protein